jgi:hypothetical protein
MQFLLTPALDLKPTSFLARPEIVPPGLDFMKTLAIVTCVFLRELAAWQARKIQLCLVLARVELIFTVRCVTHLQVTTMLGQIIVLLVELKDLQPVLPKILLLRV